MKRHASLALVCAAALLLSACERDTTTTTPATDQRPITPAEPARTEPTPPPAAPTSQPATPPQATAPTPAGGADAVHAATGTVAGVDAEAGVITINHDPVDSLGWPRMTMNFAVDDPEKLGELEKGDRIQFTFVDAGDNRFVIQDLDEGDQ
jgi:Cu(I)/Ag(I) efflux system periplasmic protein CusF